MRGTQQACGACCVLVGGFVVYMTRRVIRNRRKKSPPGRIRRSPPNLGDICFFGDPKCPVFFGDNYRKSAFSATAYGGRAYPVLQRIVKLLDCRRPNGTELPNSWHLDTAFSPAAIAAVSKAEKATWRWTGDKGRCRLRGWQGRCLSIHLTL